MALLWIYAGFCMDWLRICKGVGIYCIKALLRICYGFNNDLQWIYKRFTMDVLRTCYVFTMDLLRMCYGFTKDLQRICYVYGFT